MIAEAAKSLEVMVDGASNSLGVYGVAELDESGSLVQDVPDAVDEQTIKQYIENQGWDEDDQGFKITAPAEP